MESVNLTRVYLLSVPLENDYKHTLWFSGKDVQLEYFQNLQPKVHLTDFSYQRKEGVMRIPLSFEDAVKYNYVMYQNGSNSNKWYFAFITHYEFKGDDQTNITLETDVMQTYMFDIDIKPSFVEREHVNDDTVGLHTVPENLETGEYVCINRGQVEELQSAETVIATTMDYDGSSFTNSVGAVYGGVYSGVAYYVANNDYVEELNKWLKEFDKAGHNDAIQCMFLAPSFFFNNISGFGKNLPIAGVPEYLLPYSMEYSIKKSDYCKSNYQPKNNKLNCYPYKYLLASNNNGGGAIYQYEHFNGDTMNFAISGVITPGCSIRLLPKKYKGIEVNDEEGLNLGKYPVCNWTSDEYTNWLTQNSVNIGLNIASGVGQIVVGSAIAVGGATVTGGMSGVIGASTIVGGVSTIANQLAQIHQQSFTPPQSKGNINCGDVITATKNNTFFFYGMTAKDEYLKIIDEYFSTYGYKCNRVKIPNKGHRDVWWFTKTVDVNIIANGVPVNDLLKIKNCYNNGITFWRKPACFKNYANDNVII